MILEYSVKGYRSFKDEVRVSFPSYVEVVEHTKTILGQKMGHGDNHIAMFFGLNNAGKSNFIDSIKDFQALLKGDKKPNELVHSLNRSSGELSISFTVLFTVKQRVYEYSIAINPLENRFIFESFYTLGELDLTNDTDLNALSIINTTEDGERALTSFYEEAFVMEYDDKLIATMLMDQCLWYEIYVQSQTISLEENSKDNYLDLIDKNHLYFTDLGYFINTVLVVGAEDIPIYSDLNTIAIFLKLSDTGIVSINTEDICDDSEKYTTIINSIKKSLESDEVKIGEKILITYDSDYYECMFEDDSTVKIGIISLVHQNGQCFKLSEESEGTRRLFELSGIITSSIEDAVFIVDELDRKLHTTLSKEIVMSFDKKKALKQQLLFTTHETLLLSDDILSRDEKWLIEKVNGSSIIRNLGSTNISDNIMLDYVSGLPIKFR